MKKKITCSRNYFAAIFVIFLFSCLIWRLLDLSYFGRARYTKTIENIRKTSEIIQARRGIIYDRNREVLAVDELKTTIGVDPYAADFEGDFSKICVLSELLEIDARELAEKFSKKQKIVNGKVIKVRWVPICEVNSESLYEAVKTIGVRGVYGAKKRKRLYPFGREMAHITGFVNGENVACYGVERYMDFYLRGQDGYIESEKDGNRRELAQHRKKDVLPKDGQDIIVTIDSNVQKIVFNEVQKLVEKFSPQFVSVIVSDVATGEILALVNYPDYDPNNYGKYPIEHMKNAAVTNVYEPASVFKIVTASFGLEYGLVSENTIFDCTQPTLVYNGRTIKMPRDWKPFEKLTFTEALRVSANRPFAHVAASLGEDRFYKCVKAFGFGEKVGYGFDCESSGILSPVFHWDPLTITRMPMGHAIAVAPLQIHCAMSVIANDGILLKPNLFKCVEDVDEKFLEANPVVKRRVISSQTAERVRNMLYNPNNVKLKLENGVIFAGKSGTGQRLIDGKYSDEHCTSSYSGFFPAMSPKVVLSVIVDDAHVETGVAWGSIVAVPAFRNIAEKICQCLDLH